MVVVSWGVVVGNKNPSWGHACLWCTTTVPRCSPFCLSVPLFSILTQLFDYTGCVLADFLFSFSSQFIFQNLTFNKPFFLTYLSTSSFSLYILGFLLSPWWRRTCSQGAGTGYQQHEDPAPTESGGANSVREGAKPLCHLFTLHALVCIVLVVFLFLTHVRDMLSLWCPACAPFQGY